MVPSGRYSGNLVKGEGTMAYRVIHMIEAVEWLEELEYFRLVEQCRQTYRFLAEHEECSDQICMMVSDKVKEIPMEQGVWPGETAFRRPRKKKKPEKNEQKICFEEALQAAAVHMKDGNEWIIILYTAGAIRRSKRTLVNKWKKSLPVQPMLLAVKTEHADHAFLESYTVMHQVFSVEMQEDIKGLLRDLGKIPEIKMATQKEEELWKIIRDCFM